jgi:hypothetical protein
MQADLAPADTTTDISIIGNESIQQYEEITKTKIQTMQQASNIDEVMSQTRLRETAFSGYRHDDNRLDKFRTPIGKSLSPIDTIGNIIASAALAVSDSLGVVTISGCTY